jgi:hypothetical protein
MKGSAVADLHACSEESPANAGFLFSSRGTLNASAGSSPFVGQVVAHAAPSARATIGDKRGYANQPLAWLLPSVQFQVRAGCVCR